MNLALGPPLPSGKDRTEACLGQNAGDVGAFVALNLDPSLFHRAAGAASLLHRLGQLFLFRLTDADESRHDRHRLAAAVRRLPADIDPPAILLPSFRDRSDR